MAMRLATHIHRAIRPRGSMSSPVRRIRATTMRWGARCSEPMRNRFKYEARTALISQSTSSARLLTFTVAVVILIGQGSVFGQSFESNTSPGLRVATAICRNCHEVGAGMPPRVALGPKFEDIANLPSTTELSLKVFLHSNHEKMPNFILSSADTNNVVAYILSLKRP